jgi:hypothetical protein
MQKFVLEEQGLNKQISLMCGTGTRRPAFVTREGQNLEK